LICWGCGNEADLDGDDLCGDCALEECADGEPERGIEDVPVMEGIL
jgi:hypothetical protein